MVNIKTTAIRAARNAMLLAVAGHFATGLSAQTAASSTPPKPADSTTAATTTTTTTTTDTAAPAPAPAPASSDANTAAAASGVAVTTLEKFTVSDVPINEQILPTVRPVGSVLGDDTDILDIPRSVTTINQAWMEDRQIKNAMDFGQFSPGVYSPARYGVPATPQIRGDNAQIYENGQQTLYTGSSIFPSFNGVEGMDIVKGPGSAVYGPQTQGPGGYVNFDMKVPQFDGEHTQVTATWGYLASGHDYTNPSLQIDTGAPLSDKFAYRISYLSQYGQGYYKDDPNQTQDIYVALAYRPSKVLSIDYWAQYYGSRFADVSGANRVTQNFIWNGTYIGGPVTYPGDAFAGGVPDGSNSLVTASTAYTVKLPTYDQGLLAPGDVARTGRYQSQLIETLELPGDAKIINKTYFERANDLEFNLFGYDEFMPLQASAQDRLEFHDKFSTGSVDNQIIAGADFKYSRLLAYQDYSIEPFAAYDLYQSPALLVFPAYYAEGEGFGGGYGIPGAPKGYSTGLSGVSALQDSYIYDTAAFLQDTLSMGKYFSAVLGGRVDYFYATDANPPMTEVFNNATGQLYNPIVPVDEGAFFHTSGSGTDPSYFLSLIFKQNETSSFYFTYDKVDSVLGSGNFGGVNVSYPYGTIPANDPSFHQELETSLKTKSTLYEFGYRKSLLNNTLYFATTLYQQQKTEPQLKGPAFLVKSTGIEMEFVYQPTKALSINGNFTYQDVVDFGTSFFEQTASYLDDYPVGFIVDGQSGTGGGSPNFGYSPANNYSGPYAPPGGRMRAPGVPEMLANFFLQYELPSGFGIGIGPQIQGWQYADDEDALHIPSEMKLDGYLFYRRKAWDVQVNVTNITNARLEDPIDVTFAGNDVVYIRQPISASITFRYRM